MKIAFSSTGYRHEHPGSILMISEGSGAKMLIGTTESERHPDLSVYTEAPPEVDVWSIWRPAVVIEIISQSSTKRDYKDKTEDYLHGGAGEYWIIDQFKGVLTAHTRWRGQWRTKAVKPGQKFATPLLPGFAIDLKRIFAAAKATRG